MTTANGKRGALRIFKSYLFREKDPVIDVYRTARQDSGMTYKEIEEKGGPTASTQRGWELGKTRRPQFATVWSGLNVIGAKGLKRGADGRPRVLKE